MNLEGHQRIVEACKCEVYPVPQEGADIPFATLVFAARINYGGDRYGGGIRAEYTQDRGPHAVLNALHDAGLLAEHKDSSPTSPQLKILGINNFGVIVEDLTVTS